MQQDVKITYNVYLFDLQNPTDVLAGETPVVVETGPYVYDEYFQKFDISWSDGGDTVTYNTRRWYIFNQAASGPGLTDKDMLTLPYPSAIGFEYLLDGLDPSINAALDEHVEEQLLGKGQNVTELINYLSFMVNNSTNPDFTTAQRKLAQKQLSEANTSMQIIFADMENLFATSDTGDILLKTLMCNIPSFISPFFKANPSDAWFGWLNDPLLLEVQSIVDILSVKIGRPIPWTSGVPGAATNYTSIDDARRRRGMDTFKTGKKNKNQVGQYVRYQNMTELYSCIGATKSAAPYEEGKEFAACAHFQYEWDEKTIADMGYTHPFGSDYANRIKGTDATMFGRPVTSDKLQVFVSDIYRSVYLGEQNTEDWYGIKLKSYGIQEKDMWNYTMNPENAQYFAFGHNGIENATRPDSIPLFISFPHFLNADAQLQESIKGLHPNPTLHTTSISVEPQTGLVVKAHKRLQVNYFMESYPLPAVSPDSSTMIKTVCDDLQNVIAVLATQVPDPSVLPVLDCELQLGMALLDCLAVPSNWTMQPDLYMPYGWVSEDFELPESDADSLNNDLFSMDDVADGFRTWSLIVAGCCFFILVFMLVQNHLAARASPQGKWDNYKQGASAPDGLGFTFNPNSEHTYTGVQPLLGEKF